MHLLKFLVPSLVIATPVFAEQEVGNGGDAVYCDRALPELNNRQAMTLDLYEAKAKWRLTLALGDPDMSVDDKVRLVFARIEQVDPDRYHRYMGHLATFWDEALIEENQSLPSIPDQGAVRLPAADCRVEQLAFQQAPQLPGDRRYAIRKEIWDQLDNDSRAGLVLHEIIYREAIEQGQGNSRRSRYYNALLSADAVASITLDGYCDLLEDWIKLPAIRTLDQIVYALRSVEHDAEGNVSAATVMFRSNRQVKYGGITLAGGDRVTFSSDRRFARVDMVTSFPYLQFMKVGLTSECSLDLLQNGTPREIEFYPDGAVKTLRLEGREFLHIPVCGGEVPQGDSFLKTLKFRADRIEFYDNGVFKGGVKAASVETILTAGGKTFIAKGEQLLTFHRSGYPAEATLLQSAILRGDDGQLHEYAADTVLKFNDRGEVSNQLSAKESPS